MEWVVIAVLVIALIAVAAYAVKQRQSRRLKEGFGPEYERTVERHGDRRTAEQDLIERRQRRERFQLRELDRDEQERYGTAWSSTQRRFVDEPAAAVGEADALVRQVMQARGYPVDDDFDRRAADVSVDHPDVVEHYRAAHDISVRTTAGETGTEDLRQAMVHYRALFADLLGAQDHDHHEEEVRS